MFWTKPNTTTLNSLQYWREVGTGDSQVLELPTNKRSGEDRWYADVLDACRRGDLQELDYAFLHGYLKQIPNEDRCTRVGESRNTQSIRKYEVRRSGQWGGLQHETYLTIVKKQASRLPDIGVWIVADINIRPFL